MRDSIAIVRTRVPARRLQRAERILHRLGLTPANAVNLLFAQIEIRKGLLFACVVDHFQTTVATMVTGSKPIRLAEAKARLGRLAELSRKGKTVRFIARSELFEIVHVKRPVVVPATEEELRACYSDPEENALVNRFAQESV